jgi:hypothetical protein
MSLGYRAAGEANKIETLQCDEPSQEIGENGVEGYENLVEEENRVPVGQPATATPVPATSKSPTPAQPLKKPKP